MNIYQAWNRIHQKKTASRRPEGELVTLLAPLQGRLPPGAPVLDAGCGRGRNARYLAQLGFAVYGCDLSPVAVNEARAQLQRAGAAADLQVADLTRLPYPDNAFAASVCVHVLPYHFQADIARGVRELWRVLRPGGWLYADFLDRDDAQYGCGPALETHTFLDPDGVPIHFNSHREIDEWLNSFALEHVARRELGSGPRVAWTVWAVKLEGGRDARETD